MTIDVEKQEEVVAALWDFAEAQSLRAHNATRTNSVSVNLESVGETLERIMKMFGYEVVSIESSTMSMTDQPSGYRCQFCGETSPVREWKNDGSTCPQCGRDYDAILAQDCEDD